MWLPFPMGIATSRRGRLALVRRNKRPGQLGRPLFERTWACVPDEDAHGRTGQPKPARCFPKTVIDKSDSSDFMTNDESRDSRCENTDHITMRARHAQLASQRRSRERDNKQPNSVLVLADDLGWTGLHCFGSDFYEMPNIDRLAEQSMRFDTTAVSTGELLWLWPPDCGHTHQASVKSDDGLRMQLRIIGLPVDYHGTLAPATTDRTDLTVLPGLAIRGLW